MKKISYRSALLKSKNFLQKFAVFCLPLISVLSSAQTLTFDNVQANVTKYKKETLQEKIYLHTDKSFYLTGETLWFKAYVVNAVNHREVDFSKVVYAELVDGKGKPVLQAMIDNRQSAGDGSFLLPASLNTGMYVLRAYTAWMKNFGEADFFQTPIQIINPAKPPDWAALDAKETYAVQFFPEGGNLVDDLHARVGFRLTNQYGQGADGEGFVIKNSHDTVVRFRPFKFGNGRFEFTPQKEAAYEAVVVLSNGQKISARLPEIYKEGYALRMDEEKQRLRIAVSTNKAFTEQPVYLLVHTRGEVTFASAKILANGRGEWFLDKDSLGEGLNALTLYDGGGKPVCERLYFVKPKQKLDIEIGAETKSYATRSKVTLNLTTLNSTGDTVQSRLSLSVFLLDSLQGLMQTSIDDYFWLTSEIKGRIESPHYYLETDNEEAKTALDNLLLTQGWRRFVPDETASGKRVSFSFLPDYEGPVINGKVVNKASGATVSNALCYLSVPGENFYTTNAVSNTNGEINFLAKNSYGPLEVAVQAAGADSNLRVDLQSPYWPAYAFVRPPRFELRSSWKEQLANRFLNVQLGSAFATPAAQRFAMAVLNDSLPFYGKADTRYNLDEYTRFPSMEEVMREITAEVRVNKDRDTFRYSVLNLPYKAHFEGAPLVLLDGVPIANVNKIIGFDPQKVKRIDVVARKFFWGNTINNGIVSYSTYDGDLAGFALDPGVDLLEYNGLQVKREFYSPVYDTPAALHGREPDNRNVLLWEPIIKTQVKGGGEINFYTSDIPGRYAVMVQGVSNSGLVGSKTTVVDVKR